MSGETFKEGEVTSGVREEHIKTTVIQRSRIKVEPRSVLALF